MTNLTLVDLSHGKGVCILTCGLLVEDRFTSTPVSFLDATPMSAPFNSILGFVANPETEHGVGDTRQVALNVLQSLKRWQAFKILFAQMMPTPIFLHMVGRK